MVSRTRAGELTTRRKELQHEQTSVASLNRRARRRGRAARCVARVRHVGDGLPDRARRTGLRDREDSGREGHELFDGGGDDALATSHHGLHVLCSRHRDGQDGPMNLIGAERHTQRGVLMRRFLWLPVVVAAGIGVLTLGACLGSGACSGTWTSVFPTEPDDLVRTARNPYFILAPGCTLLLDGRHAWSTITIMHESTR